MSIISSSAVADSGPLVPAKPGTTGGQATAETTAQTTASPASAEVQLPKYSSPKIYIDPRLHDVFYEYRDPQTGAEQYTIPAQSSRAYQETQQNTQVNFGQNQQTGTNSFGQDNQGQPTLPGQSSQPPVGTSGTGVGNGPDASTLAGIGASFAAASTPAPAAPAPAPAPVSTPSVAPVSAPSASGGGSSTLA